MELQMTIIFIFLLIVSSADVQLKSHQLGIKGGSITFPDPLENGLLLFERSNIAEVKDKKIDILEETYKDRLLWNNKTGLFTIRGLKQKDSGVYSIDPKKGFSSIINHKLTVYESVAAPAVETLNVSAESCSFLCLVTKTEETTLLWYKDEEIINQSSSALSLPLTVHRHDVTSSYRCVAANPAENKTLHVDVRNICVELNSGSKSDLNTRRYMIIIPIVLAVIVILVALFIRWFVLNHKKSTIQTQVNRDSDVVYSDVHINADRCSQGRNLPDSSEPDEHPGLRSVYYKLGPHPLSPPETDDHVYDQATNFPHA
ncbi:natural killer cell receptor 2B4-like isoform X1 [Labrus mixtus]|uniref:natural killer cell receptor 2B4-like isoform X1 n=1 Tax=Labrus mixtus TaxID=508554 RepID=UPI0029C00D8E|nr:natural killer cell receptor 2B4-like isoform X1 [Labrus mixtus]